ncbi:MAG: GNAT family N-acetyltransferase [Vulcanimicrobiaceae bacterium]
MRTLRTPRLRLVPVTQRNAAELWQVLQQPDLRAYQDLPSVGAATFEGMVGRRPRCLTEGAVGRFEWLVYMQRSRRALGWVSLRVSAGEPGAAEIGYSVVREFRARGIATEAVSALIDEGFASAGLSLVRAYCVPENQASRRVLERLGFTRESVLARGASVSGRPVDVLSHVMVRERWERNAGIDGVAAVR